ncbi:MAG: carbohydrate-binding domain-containing protein [Candidatus Bathyarchaeia archaeon]
MDKGLVAMAVACIAILAFFIGYQISISGSPKEATTDGAADWDPSITVELTLKGDSIEVSNSKPVSVNGSKATILFGGTYKITGTLNDGRIIVYTNDKDPVKLILNGVHIRCSTGSPISIMNAEETFIILAEGTENFVEDSAEYIFDDPAKNEPDAAIFCKSNLTIMGEGVLNVKGNYNDGITSKDGLIIQSGTINVKSVDDGIRGRDLITVKSGVLNLEVGGDGLKSDNPENTTLGNIFVENGTINIVSGGDAFQAEKKVLINGGSFNLKAGGESSSTAASNVSAKGIKALDRVAIEGGVFEIYSADDALHSNGTVTVNGGSLNLSSADDAIHAGNLVEITGGNINIARSFEGIESATVKINGGAIRIISSNDGINAVLNGQNPDSGDVIILNGFIEIKADGDGIQADRNVTIAGGDFVFTTGGGGGKTVAANASAKGVKGVAGISIKGGKFTISSADDTIHSNGAITVNAGTLALSSSDDAIHAEGSIEINGGIIKIAQAFEGIEGEIITVNGGEISIVSSDDGIDAKGSLTITQGTIDIQSGGDAMQASTDVLISGGNFNFTSAGGSLSIIGRNDSAKGIKADVSLTINGGTFRIDSADDAIHSDGKVTITGGSLTLLTGDDTIHGGGSVAVTGGDIKIINAPGDLGNDPWDSSTIVDVWLKGNSIEASASRPAYISGNKVMIRSAGTYRIAGTLNEGQIIVNTKDSGAVKLILNGAQISCSNNAPICVLDASEVILHLEAGTENAVTDGAVYVFASPNADEPNAAVFSRTAMKITGSGLLRVTGRYNDGIASKGGLIIENGMIAVNSVDDGIRGKDYLIIKGGKLTVNAGGDGLKADNTLNASLGYVRIENGSINIVAGGEAVQAETNVLITGGNFDLTCGGGSTVTVAAGASAKGIKGKGSIVISVGFFAINSADDAVHSDDAITVNGGSFVISTADDGIHAETSITINNGEINITNSYEGIEAPVITINGGTIHVISRDDGINLGIDSGAISPAGQPGARFSIYSGDYYLYINGGYIYVNALGDGIDSNGAVVMNGGFVIVDGPSSDMNSALDHVAFNMTKGYLVAVGSAGMALPLGDLSAQYSVMLNFRTVNQAGTLICVRASNGTELFTFRPTRQYQSIVFSTPELSLGSTYDVYIGGSHTGTLKDGLYSGGTYIPGTKYTSFTITAKVTQIGSSGWFFPFPR